MIAVSTQYAIHRDDFQQRLFHGYDSASAEKIIQECVNRSFAGVNGKLKLNVVFIGTLYGSGVYFHTHAKYSHNDAKVDAVAERVMFYARVLVGKTHIFVVYHDAGAYAEYLITYI